MKSMREQIEAAAETIRHSGELIGSAEAWMISVEEMSVFDLSAQEWHILAATYDAYLAFMDIVDPSSVGIDDDTIVAERERWPKHFNAIPEISEAAFAALAKDWMNIDSGQAGKTYAKMRFWNERDLAEKF